MTNLDANDLFNNKFGRAKPAFHQNQFGGTLGGPIRHDKPFFFMDYLGWRVRNALTYSSSVPTDLMRAGDFSELSRAIYDPHSQQPFSGNRIPASRYDVVSKNIMDQLYPAGRRRGRSSTTFSTTPLSSGRTINSTSKSTTAFPRRTSSSRATASSVRSSFCRPRCPTVTLAPLPATAPGLSARKAYH